MLSIKDDNFNLGAKVRQKCCSKKNLMLRLGEEVMGEPMGIIKGIRYLRKQSQVLKSGLVNKLPPFECPRNKCFHNVIILIVICFNLYGIILQLFLVRTQNVKLLA